MVSKSDDTRHASQDETCVSSSQQTPSNVFTPSDIHRRIVPPIRPTCYPQATQRGPTDRAAREQFVTP
jgi:hypothetical protein